MTGVGAQDALEVGAEVWVFGERGGSWREGRGSAEGEARVGWGGGKEG